MNYFSFTFENNLFPFAGRKSAAEDKFYILLKNLYYIEITLKRLIIIFYQLKFKCITFHKRKRQQKQKNIQKQRLIILVEIEYEIVIIKIVLILF